MNKELLKAVKLAGNYRKLAEICGVARPQIYSWLKHGVPPKRVLMIEKAFKGKISRHRLRPDIYPRGI